MIELLKNGLFVVFVMPLIMWVGLTLVMILNEFIGFIAEKLMGR